MSKAICPRCGARIPLPKHPRPLSGPGISRADSSPACPSCDPDLIQWNAERRALRSRRRLGVFAKAMILCVVMAVLCMAGGTTVLGLDPEPKWADPVEQGFMVGAQVFLALGILMKIAYKLFEEPDRPA